MSKKTDTLEFCAQKFRDNNEISSNEPIRLKSILQKNSILTVYRKLDSSFSGMSIKIGDGENCKRFILVNSEHSIGKQHFTICHEIYHLYYQKDFSSALSCTGKFDKTGNPEEYDADMFAAYLLLPRWGVWEFIPEKERSKNKISISTVLAIEHYYSCSRTALLHRLSELGLIDDIYKSQFLSDIKNQARKLGYSVDLYEKGNDNLVVGNYGTLAFQAWEKGIISESTYFSFLQDIGIDISKIDENDTDNGCSE